MSELFQMEPDFRSAHSVVAEIRGFDLDDDEFQLSRFQPDTAYAPLDRRFYSILFYRAGRYDKATELLSGQKDPASRFLSALLVARSGQLETALKALAIRSDEDLQLSSIHWARGEILWRLGRHQEAVKWLKKASREGAWLDLARLHLQRQDYAAAQQALARVDCELDSHSSYLQALVRTGLGDLVGALDSLGLATEAMRQQQAPQDRGLEKLWDRPEFLALTRVEPAPDLTWLRRFGCLEGWMDHAALKFLGQEESESLTQRLRKRYAGSYHLGFLWTAELWQWCQEMVESLTVVALGPVNLSRSNVEISTALVSDGKKVWLAPSLEMPPPLWPAIERADLDTALRHFHPGRLSRLQLTHEIRAFMGYRSRLVVPNPYSGELVEAEPHELSRHWNFSPCLDPMSWGGARGDDPWPERIPPQPGYMVKIAGRMRAVLAQAEGGISRTTMRTYFSRSQVTSEYHSKGRYAWEVRFLPNPFPQVVADFNQRLGTSFPENLPVDVVGALHGFPFLTLPEIIQDMQDDLEQTPAYIHMLAAVGHTDLRTAYELRRYIRDPEERVRSAVANMAVDYHWLFLLEELALLEPPEDSWIGSPTA